MTPSSRPMRIADLSALPPVYDRSKELIGVIGLKPVLPCYFEVEPHMKYLELSLEEIQCLLEMELDEGTQAQVEGVADTQTTTGADA